MDIQQVAAKNPAKDYDDLFDDDDDRLMDEGLSDTKSPAKKAVGWDDDDDDFLVPATGRVKNRGAFLDDENSLDTGSLKLGQDKLGEKVLIMGVESLVLLSLQRK
ncbi:WD repeat and HMG-box DNA-binding protein 1-like [Haplochromis burtoni]|uniref:WD repeat and HMG-box DNA-binding protein 1-like n=1 Tax=Haplochromis burtoni TaxID=8153 RepID=UPI001C2D2E2E|nr:WD repeat and HMG-box DNA-binding protein 1-like [Haplochromis burtoni]